jgi:hypothetical protein
VSGLARCASRTPPKPEAIRDTVELVALFSSRLGGRADGWQMRERPGSGYLT